MPGKWSYQDKWKAEHTVTTSIRFQKTTDADLLEWLEKCPSKQGEIKRLMRIAIAYENWKADHR